MFLLDPCEGTSGAGCHVSGGSCEGEFDDDGNPKMRRRKADDEHLIRNQQRFAAIEKLKRVDFEGAVGYVAILYRLACGSPASFHAAIIANDPDQ